MNQFSKKSCFCKNFIKINNLDKIEFDEWFFHPGMLFNNINKWWAPYDYRKTPHEGVDFYLFKDKKGSCSNIQIETKIPIIFEGEVVKIDNDFLGKSIYLSHDIFNDNNCKLHSIYAHTAPHHLIKIGNTLDKNEIISTLAPTKTQKQKIPPHLHLSTVWLPDSTQYNKLNWETINNPQIATLCNPLDFF